MSLADHTAAILDCLEATQQRDRIHQPTFEMAFLPEAFPASWAAFPASWAAFPASWAASLASSVVLASLADRASSVVLASLADRASSVAWAFQAASTASEAPCMVVLPLAALAAALQAALDPSEQLEAALPAQAFQA